MLTVACLHSLLAAHPALHRLIVAYSGGVDSHVLLHLLASHRASLGNRALLAVYVDHGLQPAAGHWGEHCAAVCRELGVEFSRLRVKAHPRPGESPEAAARQARYGALADLLGERDVLLTAQHQDDQAETLLLQLLRGGGPHGLAAMPASAPLGRGWLLRPLLAVERAEILAYARLHQLRWVEDTSNLDQRLDRNYLRHTILPLLKARWPAVSRTLARSARLCAEAATLLDTLADADLAQAAGGRPDRLHIPALCALDEARLRNALRHWFRRLQLPSPGAVVLERILREAIFAARDRRPLIHWPGGEVRRHRDDLFAMPPLIPHDPGRRFPIRPGEALAIASLGRLDWQPVRGAGLRADALAGRSLTLRFRQGGERFRPLGRRHGQALKKLLQEAGIPPWERDRLPLLYVDDRLAAVANLWVEADLATPPDADGWRLAWQKAAPFDNV